MIYNILWIISICERSICSLYCFREGNSSHFIVEDIDEEVHYFNGTEECKEMINENISKRFNLTVVYYFTDPPYDFVVDLSEIYSPSTLHSGLNIATPLIIKSENEFTDLIEIYGVVQFKGNIKGRGLKLVDDISPKIVLNSENECSLDLDLLYASGSNYLNTCEGKFRRIETFILWPSLQDLTEIHLDNSMLIFSSSLGKEIASIPSSMASNNFRFDVNIDNISKFKFSSSINLMFAQQFEICFLQHDEISKKTIDIEFDQHFKEVLFNKPINITTNQSIDLYFPPECFVPCTLR